MIGMPSPRIQEIELSGSFAQVVASGETEQLRLMYGDRKLNFQEFSTVLKRIACVLNSRPIYATAQLGSRLNPDPEFLYPLTPNMLLLGRSDDSLPMKDYSDSDKPLKRLQYVSDLESLWWNQYKIQEFSSLVPTQKWTEAKRNMLPGDIVLIQYSTKSKAGEYRLGRVITIEVDTDDLVRTVVVKYSLIQHLKEQDRLKYKGITMKYIRVSVQRLVLIVPVEEQEGGDAVISDEDVRKAKELPKEIDEDISLKKCQAEGRILKKTESLIKPRLEKRYELNCYFSQGQMQLWKEAKRDFLDTYESNLSDDKLDYRDICERPYLFKGIVENINV